MTKKNSTPTKNAASKVPVTKAKSSKVVAKTTKAPPIPQSKAKAKPAASSGKTAAKPVVAAKVSAKSAPKAAAKPAASVTKPAVTKAAAPKPIAAKPVAAKPTAGKPIAPKPVATADRQAAHPQQRAMPAAASKPAAPRLTAPVTAKPAVVAPKPSPAPAAPAAQATPPAEKKPVTARHGFKTNELIVYPAHGVGRIIGIEEQEIAGISLELFVIEFEKDKMTLRVPTGKLASVGMRKLAEGNIVQKALDTLKGRARIKRTMWSRRAQEYEAKINSGDIVAIAEVVRDLYRSEAQPEQSYSERQLYEAALDRMARELAAVDKSDERSAMQRITEILAKSARGRRAAEEAQASEQDADNDGEVKAA